MRVHLSDFENTAIAKAAPAEELSGTVIRRVALRDWGDDWFLLALDSPLEYHGRSYDQILIRSRLVGYELGRDKGTMGSLLSQPNPPVRDKWAEGARDFQLWAAGQKRHFIT